MTKTEYAKYQFMILVLRALILIVINVIPSREILIWKDVAPKLDEINKHILFIQDLMKEE